MTGTINPGPTRPLRGQKIAVLGGGMVGVCVALEFQKRGGDVVLVDRDEPGNATSFGNAGVFARSSLLPINSPAIFKELPALLSNRRLSFRYDLAYLLSNLLWVSRFLLSARGKIFAETTKALDSLIRLSFTRNLDLINACNESGRLTEKGWIFLYRTDRGFKKSTLFRDTMRHFEVATQELDGRALHDLEPHLLPIFPRALWIRDSFSINNPSALVKAYALRFATLGGTVQRGDVTSVCETSEGVEVSLSGADTLKVDKGVVCMGPWSKSFLENFKLSVPMAFERGYHRQFTGGQNAAILGRPVHDTQGGYVLAPMEKGLRLSTGVELAACDAPVSNDQIERAERAAREAFPLGECMEPTPWLGRRPTFPDSRPVIGRAPTYRNVFLAFGHHHIGLTTGAGTADVLADLVEGIEPAIDERPFRPERFIRPIP